MRTATSIVLGLLVLGAAEIRPVSAQSSSAREITDRWLERQAAIETWSAEVVQTRRIQSISRPLKATGRVWFRHPNRFRWQLGDPPRTVAVRTRDELVLMYPSLKQAERFALGEDIGEQWRQALALLEVGFPRDRESFYAGYEPLSVERNEDRWRLVLRPAGQQARQLIEQVRFEIDADDFKLLATELLFPSGSSMRNDFHHHLLDPELDDALFEVDLDESWNVSRPLERGS